MEPHPEQTASNVRIRAARREELAAAAELLGVAMADNPNHVAAYGGEASLRAERHAVLMRAVLGRRRGEVRLGAFHGDDVVGFVAVTPTPGCRPSPREVACLLPSLARLGPAVLARVLAWQRAWAGHHPTSPHLHVGPLAVHPDWRGRGLGRQLLDRVVRGQGGDETALPAYLESDRKENVGFYRAAGFAVRSEGTVLGRPNWFMDRTPESRQSGS